MAGRGRELRRLAEQKSFNEMNNGTSKADECRGVELLAKYSYKPNPARPGGFGELGVKQGEKLRLVKKGFQENPHWWMVKNEREECGYVPAQYLMELENKVTSLPWLAANNVCEKTSTEDSSSGNKFGVPEFKPYKSAYGNNPAGDYYCKICERKFNGPIPFRAHMSSKSHKEEEEIAKQYGRV